MKRITRMIIGTGLGCIMTCSYAHTLRADLTPNQIVDQVDQVRNPIKDFSMIAEATSYKPNNRIRKATYEVMIKGKTNTIIKTMEPKNEIGQALLMRGSDFWAFFPEVAQPLRISFQQKLMGEISNGDIARTNFSGDYNASLTSNEEVNGKKYYVLQLTAKSESATYGKVMLWVEHDRYWPLKAEFYAISGRFLKTCLFEDYKMIAGTERPSRLVLTDAINKGQYSVLEYKNVQIGDIPEKYFHKDYLKKVSL